MKCNSKDKERLIKYYAEDGAIEYTPQKNTSFELELCIKVGRPHKKIKINKG